MKLILLALLSSLALAPLDEPEDPVADTVGIYDYSVLKTQGHPRILMSSADFNDLKSKVKATHRSPSSMLYVLHDKAVRQADAAAVSTKHIEYKLDASGKRLLTQSRNALLELFSCAYAYRMTGSVKYLTHVIDVLVDVCSFPDWHPSHYLDTGELAFGVAVAYDWLYQELPGDLRAEVRRALSEYVLRTCPDQDFYHAKGNWNQVCNAGVIAAALAVYEFDKQASWRAIEEGVQSNRKAVSEIYGEDGNYPEGYGYWSYGTNFQVLIIEMLRRAFGSSDALGPLDGFYKTADYMLFMAGANGGVFPYADGGSARENANIAMWWFGAEAADPRLVTNEKRLLFSDAYDAPIRLLPMVPCFLKDVNLDRYASFASDKEFWCGNGRCPVAMIHTGWNFNDGDRYVGIKGGCAVGGHAHLDAGSFVYDAMGVRWSEDYPRMNYAKTENALKALGGNFWSFAQKSLRWDIMRMNNLGHSTVSCMTSDGSVAGKVHPSDHCVKGKATFEEVYDSPEKMGVRIDMSQVLKDGVASASRTITLNDHKDLVIVDEITAKDSLDAEIQWRMVTMAEVLSTGEDGEMLSRDGRLLHLGTSSSSADVRPEYMVWKYERPADWAVHDWEYRTLGSIVGYRVTVPAGRSVTLTTVLTPVARKTTYF